MPETLLPQVPSELPLFPLNTVLFPGAGLPLKVFEARYMDLVSRCLREQTGFGICLIAEGPEVGGPARPETVGVLAQIADCDMSQPGILQIRVVGEQRFRVAHVAHDANGLARAVVEWLPEAAGQPVPPEFADIVPLLRAVVADAGPENIPEPHHFDDACWVGHRYAQILPIPAKAKQKLLELDDPLLRLSIVREFLIQRGLLTPAG
ncbi:LON peptidase substrate-binding domain-containing protein [Niveibacterium sp. SC-1]|uniref:LON peptidase substrate-binding domain-containing protein n=1 Tax=Niveibacterium sp. SC-1 TaxID=3135646 RepID=UPI00311DABD6